MDALLAFIGDHRFVLPAQAGALLGISEEAASSRLRELTDAGYLIEEPVLAGQPVAYRSTRIGLDVIGSDLRPLPISLKNYWHDVGAAWLWLAARNGAFGPMREVLAERVMRSRDARGRDDPFGVRLGGVGRDGRERLHYPDLLLVDHGARRLALELEMTSKSPAERERILAGYAADPRIARVLYIVYKPQVAQALSASVSRLGISSLIAVHRVRGPDRPHPPAGRTRGIARHDQRRVAELAR
ncbi:MAG: hypothetical protein ACXVHJ_30825 [Solirubrobacteraceae bacterium]